MWFFLGRHSIRGKYLVNYSSVWSAITCNGAKPLKLKEIAKLCYFCLTTIAPLIYDTLKYSLFNHITLRPQNWILTELANKYPIYHRITHLINTVIEFESPTIIPMVICRGIMYVYIALNVLSNNILCISLYITNTVLLRWVSLCTHCVMLLRNKSNPFSEQNNISYS